MIILHLTLKKKWFDMISIGEKKEEYREIKDFWIQRLCYEDSDMTGKDQIYSHSLQKNFSIRQDFDVVVFKNGYAKNAPSLTLEFKGIDIGSAFPEWSDNWEGDVFIIKLGKILKN